MQRNNAIDAVKGFAILLVMIGHCIVLNGLDATDPFLYDVIKSVQMPLFMLVSGVLAATGVKRTGSGSGFKKLPSRAVSYLVPFFSWFVIVHVYVHAKAGTLSVMMFGKELRELLLQTDRGLWFLMTLFVATVCVMIAQTVADKAVAQKTTVSKENRSKKLLVFLAVSACLYLLFFLQSRMGNTLLSPSLTLQYFPFYLMGYAVNGYAVNGCGAKLQKAEPVIVAVMLAVFVLMAAFMDLSAPVDGIVTLGLQMTASFFGTVSCFAVVYRLAEKRQKKTEKRGFLSFVGLYTLEIYVLHFRFARLLGLAEKGLQFYSPEGILWTVLTFALMSALTAISIIILQRIPLVSFLLFGKKHVSLRKGGR